VDNKQPPGSPKPGGLTMPSRGARTAGLNQVYPMKQKRNRQPNTAFAKRLRRLRWDLTRAAQWTRKPYKTLKNYNQGRTPAPRAIMRLLAAYRLMHWGDY